MLHPPGFFYVKKPKRFVILSSDKSSEGNLSCFFDIRKPRRMEHLQSEEPFFSDPYFRTTRKLLAVKKQVRGINTKKSKISSLQTNQMKFRYLFCAFLISLQLYLIKRLKSFTCGFITMYKIGFQQTEVLAVNRGITTTVGDTYPLPPKM